MAVPNLYPVCGERAKTSQRAKTLPLQRALSQTDLLNVCPVQRDPKISIPEAQSLRGERSRSREQDQAGALSPAHRAATQIHAVDRAKNNSSISI